MLDTKQTESNSFHSVLYVEKILKQEIANQRYLAPGTTINKLTKTKKDTLLSRPSMNSNHAKTQSTSQSEYVFMIIITKVKTPCLLSKVNVSHVKSKVV